MSHQPPSKRAVRVSPVANGSGGMTRPWGGGVSEDARCKIRPSTGPECRSAQGEQVRQSKRGAMQKVADPMQGERTT